MSSVICWPFWTRSQPVQLTVSLHSQVAWGATFLDCDPIHRGLFMSESVFTWLPTSRHCTCHIVCIVHDTRHLKASQPWWRHQMEPVSPLLPFVRGIHRSPVNSPHKGQWRGALMFSVICVWINDWVNNREAGDLRRDRGHYDVTVMMDEIQLYPVIIRPIYFNISTP